MICSLKENTRGEGGGGEVGEGQGTVFGVSVLCAGTEHEREPNCDHLKLVKESECYFEGILAGESRIPHPNTCKSRQRVILQCSRWSRHKAQEF